MYGKFHLPVVYSDNKLVVDYGTEVACFSQADPLQLPWKDLGVDVVLECTGRFTKKEMASQLLHAGAKKVLLSTTGWAGDTCSSVSHSTELKKRSSTRALPGSIKTASRGPILHEDFW